MKRAGLQDGIPISELFPFKDHPFRVLDDEAIAVMFVSSEMPEVMGIADRIIVMCDGRITGEVMARQTSQTEILTLATKFENKFAAEAN